MLQEDLYHYSATVFCIAFCIFYCILYSLLRLRDQQSRLASGTSFCYTTGHSNPDRVGEITKSAVTYFEESLVRFQYQESFKKEVQHSSWGELKEFINLDERIHPTRENNQ